MGWSWTSAEAIICTLFLTYVFLSRLCPCILAWIIQYKYQCSISIERIGLVSFALHNVCLKTNEFYVLFDRVGFTSSCFNGDAPKLVSINIGTASIVRIPKANNTTTNGSRTNHNGGRQKYKTPRFVTNLVQFLGIQIHEIKIWGWENVDDEKGLHFNAHIENITVDGCATVGSATSICACIVVNLGKIRVRVIENYLPEEEDLTEPVNCEFFEGLTGLKFIEGNFDFRLNVIFSPKSSGEFIDNFSIEVEKLILGWEYKERSLVSLKKLLDRRRSDVEDGSTDGLSESWIEKVEHAILCQSIPKEIKFRIFETECQITDVDSSTEFAFESKLAGLSFTSKCLVVKVNGLDMVNFESQLDLGLIRIEPDTHQYFSVDQLSNYIKLAKHNLTIDFDISNFSLKTYEKLLLFSKAKFLSNLVLINQFPKGELRFKEVVKSIDKITFGTSQLEVQYNEKSGSASSVYFEVQCKDLSRIWTEDNCSLEVVIKNLKTAMKYMGEGTVSPIALDLLGFQFKREQIGAKLSGSRVQWVPRVENILKSIMTLKGSDSSGQTARTETVVEGDRPYLKGINVEVFDTKMLYMSDNKLCLNADLTSLITTSDQRNRTINVERFEVFSSSSYSDCTLNPLFTIPRCDITLSTMGQSSRVEVATDSDIVIYWSPLLHKQLVDFRNCIKKLVSIFSSGESQSDSDGQSSRTTCFIFKKNFTLIAKLAKNHSVEFSFDNWTVEKGPNHFEWTAVNSIVRCDGTHVVGNFQDLKLSKSPKNLSYTTQQRHYSRLSQDENITWLVNITKTSLTFPYGYNFASAFNEEFVTCFKWLKKLHYTPTKGPIVPWADLYIKLQTVRIEVGDDPFEVKLRDNFELLEDEQQEITKRNQILDAKIKEIYKTNFVSTVKIEELKRRVVETSANIYIQRSKQLYKNHPLRTHLLLWELTGVQITSMADPTMCHPDQVKKLLREMDPDSPWPAEDIEFTTLWCRAICFDVDRWRVQLRDFPQPLMDSSNIHFWGKLAAGEQVAHRRALRSCEVEVGGPYKSEYVERSLNGLKWYYDLSGDIETLSFAFGPCWEPVLAQCNLAFENIFPPAKDPSRPLPFWDKIRLLFHGRLYMAVDTLTHFLHASLDPYNTTEEMEVTWKDVATAWNNGKIIFDGSLDIYVRTASKYDDVRMMHLPNLRLTFKLNWVCLADPNDHHSVQLCAPDKLPEYSSNQEHDSYRAFRSQNLNMNITFDTKVRDKADDKPSMPTATFFGSTLRWFENLKIILSGTTRPTRRGVLFKNTRPKKIPISRHYKKIRLSVSMNSFHICYWVSFSMQSGVEFMCGKVSSSSEHQLALQLINDGLIHRPKADWSVLYVNMEVNESEFWLQSCVAQEMNSELPNTKAIEKFFFMRLDKFSYGREALTPISAGEENEGNKSDTPQHRLVVHQLKGAWTNSNRDVAFALFDSFVKVQQLRKNLSTEALKSFFSKHDGPSGSPLKKSNGDSKKSRGSEVTSPNTTGPIPKSSVSSSPLTILQGSNATTSLLEKLISEADSRGVVFSEDLTAPPPQQSLHGVAQSSLDDVIHHKWRIELVNCQVLLKGCETQGYVIVSAAKAHILQREHKPVWKHGTLVPKTTWVGASEGMQYYATVSPGGTGTPDERILWVTVENIEEKHNTTISSVPEMVGSGQSVGGVVSETVGESSDTADDAIQLQRIISRCKCEFFYTTYGETGVDKIPLGIPDIPPAPRDLDPWDEGNKPVEAFTLMHYDLNVFTNSLQYAMIMDIVNNLVLFVDPKRKEGFEKLQRLRFKLQLQSTEAQRGPIQDLQNHLRSVVNNLRRLEREAYSTHKQVLEDPTNDILRAHRASLEQQVNECKESVAAKGEELHMMIMCYKEAKLAATQRLSRKRDNKDVSLVRVYEICFKHAQWRLTQTDGQLGIADLILSNFLYTKTAKSDDSIEHLSELGYITVTNLLPNQIYKDVLSPTHIHESMPIDRQRTLRVFCRDRPPVGGIAVKEHFEINIAPITIGMTYQFFKTLFKFCFPEKDPEKLDDDTDSLTDSMSTGSSSSSWQTVSTAASASGQSSGVYSGSGITSSTGISGGSVMSGTTTMPGSGSSILESHNSFASLTATLPPIGKVKPKKAKKKESKFYVAMKKDDVERMKERADKNMLFICVKIPEVPVRVSYKGEKDKNIEDVHDVHITIPTLEYNNITWTWLDFLVAVRNHSKRVLLSQAIKQKLQIWPKVNMGTTGPQEEDKAKMLLGLPIEPKGLKRSLFRSKK